MWNQYVILDSKVLVAPSITTTREILIRVKNIVKLFFCENCGFFLDYLIANHLRDNEDKIFDQPDLQLACYGPTNLSNMSLKTDRTGSSLFILPT